MAAEIVDLPNPVDIVKMMRQMADRIEGGEFPELQFVVAVLVDRAGRFVTCGWGQMSILEAIGALARAQRGDLMDEPD